MNKGRVIITIVFMVVAFFTYTLTEVYSYSLKTEQKALESSIVELEAELSDLEVKMNMLSSQENVMNTHPELEYNDNVYYLESYE